MKRVLLLDRSFRPVRTIDWKVAITELFTGKIDVVVSYDEEIRSPSITMKAPAVVRLKKDSDSTKKQIRFSRINVYTRDRFTCAYCGQKKEFKELTYDHVLPRHLGGATNFLNITAACVPCNRKKGGRTTVESGMYPRVNPYKPKTLPMTIPFVDKESCPSEWLPFLP